MQIGILKYAPSAAQIGKRASREKQKKIPNRLRDSQLKWLDKTNVFGNFLPQKSQKMSNEERIAKACGRAINFKKSINGMLKNEAVKIFVRLEMTKRFEAKSLINPMHNKKTIKILLSVSFCCEKSANMRGVKTKIAPSFARKVERKAPNKTRKIKSFHVGQQKLRLPFAKLRVPAKDRI